MVVELMKHFMEIYGEAPVQTYVDGVVHEPRVATINALVSPGDPLQIKGIPEADGTRPVVMASDIIARNLYHSRREHQAARIRVARRAERQDEHVSSSGHWAGEPYASRLLRPDFPTAYRPFLERSVNNAFLSLGR